MRVGEVHFADWLNQHAAYLAEFGQKHLAGIRSGAAEFRQKAWPEEFAAMFAEHIRQEQNRPGPNDPDPYEKDREYGPKREAP